MSLRPNKGRVALSILGVYTHTRGWPGNVGLTLPSKYLPCSLDRAGHKIYNLKYCFCLLVPVIIEPRMIYLLDVRQEMVYLHKRCVATVCGFPCDVMLPGNCVALDMWRRCHSNVSRRQTPVRLWADVWKFTVQGCQVSRKKYICTTILHCTVVCSENSTFVSVTVSSVSQCCQR